MLKFKKSNTTDICVLRRIDILTLLCSNAKRAKSVTNIKCMFFKTVCLNEGVLSGTAYPSLPMTSARTTLSLLMLHCVYIALISGIIHHSFSVRLISSNSFLLNCESAFILLHLLNHNK